MRADASDADADADAPSGVMSESGPVSGTTSTPLRMVQPIATCSGEAL
jgi:hypothetical protein